MPEWLPNFERDPALFYAGDLRAMGVELPEHIPDCAHTPRASVKFGYSVAAITEEEVAEGTLKMDMKLEFTEPFEWFNIKVKFPTEEVDDVE